MSDDKKSPEMFEFLDDVSKEMFGTSRSECIKQEICVTCGGEAKEFDDSLSLREYKISGMCQNCQNVMFGMPDDETEPMSDVEQATERLEAYDWEEDVIDWPNDDKYSYGDF